MDHLSRFAAFIKNEFLDEFVHGYLDLMLAMDIPVMNLFRHLTREEMFETSKVTNKLFLEGFENGTAIELYEKNLHEWETDTIPSGVPKRAIQPSDIALIYAVQKKLLNKFIPRYTKDLDTGIAIVDELEDYYTAIQRKAVEMLFKIQKAAEEELERKNAQLEEAQAIAHVGSWEWDAHGQAISWSNEMYRIYGLEPRSRPMRREDIYKHLLPEQVQPLIEGWKEAVKTKQPFKQEYIIVRETGERRVLETQCYPIFDEQGELIRVHGTAQDITEIRQAEIDREISRQKDEFLSIASHELKTPLTSVIAYIDLMDRMVQERHEAAELARYVFKAKASLVKLNRLIADLLDVSKIQAGKLQLNIAHFNFSEVLHDCIESIGHLAPGYRVTIKGDPGIEVTGDKHRIEQVLMNYLTNAVKYSPKNKDILINVWTDKRNLVVEVTDYGIGIPSEKQNKIFQRFYRVNENAQQFTGLGIGLYISFEIIKRHKGKVDVKSEEGKGSTFCFSIPLDRRKK